MVKAVNIQSATVLDDDKGDAHKYLTFLLPGKIFAVSIMKIKEIIEYGKVIEVPMMPDFINGAINLRGQVIPVIDLNVRLGSSKMDVSRRSCIVVVDLNLGGQAKKVGLLVDAVSKVVDFHNTQIDEAPSFNGNINTDYIEGMGKTDDGFIILLNIDSLLSMEDMKNFTKISKGEALAAHAKTPVQPQPQARANVQPEVQIKETVAAAVPAAIVDVPPDHADDDLAMQESTALDSQAPLDEAVDELVAQEAAAFGEFGEDTGDDVLTEDEDEEDEWGYVEPEQQLDETPGDGDQDEEV